MRQVGQAGDAGVGDGAEHLQDGREVGGRDVRAHHPGFPAAGQQLLKRPGDPLEQFGEMLAAVGMRQHVDERAVGRDQLERPLKELGEPRPGVGIGRRLPGDGDGPVDALPQELAGELVLVGEVTVGGGDVDPGVPGDVIERRVEPAGGEHFRGGVDKPLAVAGRVRPEPARARDHGGRGPRRGLGPVCRGSPVRSGNRHQACTATACGSSDDRARPGRSSRPVTTAAPAKTPAATQNTTW